MEQCVICFQEFAKQEIGIPEHCQHSFCFTCLIDWSKENSTCPNDRQTFQFVLKKRTFFSRKPYAKVDIRNDQVEIYLEKNFPSCQACGDGDQECSFLTCAKCCDCYHLLCLNSFDRSRWICSSCGHTNRERRKNLIEAVNNALIVRLAKKRIKTFALEDQDRTDHHLQQPTPKNAVRRIGIVDPIRRKTTIRIRENETKHSDRPVMTQNEAARQIAASGLPICPCPRSIALKMQEQNMAILKRKRKQFARLPPKIPVNQLPRIQRRADAPLLLRSKPVSQRPRPSASASFIDKLLHSQNHLLSLQNVQVQGAQIKLS